MTTLARYITSSPNPFGGDLRIQILARSPMFEYTLSWLCIGGKVFSFLKMYWHLSIIFNCLPLSCGGLVKWSEILTLFERENGRITTKSDLLQRFHLPADSLGLWPKIRVLKPLACASSSSSPDPAGEPEALNRRNQWSWLEMSWVEFKQHLLKNSLGESEQLYTSSTSVNMAITIVNTTYSSSTSYGYYRPNQHLWMALVMLHP